MRKTLTAYCLLITLSTVICSRAYSQIAGENDFAVNGKFYHDVRISEMNNGVAKLCTREGYVDAPWDSLPLFFRVHNAEQKTASEAVEAERKAKPTESGGTVGPRTKLIGMSVSALVDVLGKPEFKEADAVMTGCINLGFPKRSAVDNKSIVVIAQVIDNTCLGITYSRDAKDGGTFENKEIAHWMLAYSQGTKAQWKQVRAKTWTLESNAELPYKYNAEMISPSVFSIHADALYNRIEKAQQKADAEVQAVPGLDASAVPVYDNLPPPERAGDTSPKTKKEWMAIITKDPRLSSLEALLGPPDAKRVQDCTRYDWFGKVDTDAEAPNELRVAANEYKGELIVWAIWDPTAKKSTFFPWVSKVRGDLDFK